MSSPAIQRESHEEPVFGSNDGVVQHHVSCLGIRNTPRPTRVGLERLVANVDGISQDAEGGCFIFLQAPFDYLLVDDLWDPRSEFKS